MSGLRKIPIYRALNRSGLILGCDRELLLSSALIATTMIFVAATILSAIIGVMLWIVCFALLRKMGKADPQLRQIYLRHIKYQAYYPPRATPFAPGAIWQHKTGKVK